MESNQNPITNYVATSKGTGGKVAYEKTWNTQRSIYDAAMLSNPNGLVIAMNIFENSDAQTFTHFKDYNEFEQWFNKFAKNNIHIHEYLYGNQQRNPIFDLEWVHRTDEDDAKRIKNFRLLDWYMTTEILGWRGVYETFAR